MTERTKASFIQALTNFAARGGGELCDPVYDRKGYVEHRGERVLAQALAEYLANPAILEDEYSNWYAHLDSNLVDAFVEFRTDDKWASLRNAYEREAERQLPDLVDVHIGGLHRLLLTHSLAHLCTVLSGETWLHEHLKAYFSAQQMCIDQAWARFVRVGYRQIMPRIKDESHRGNKGVFGKTTLMTYAIAGRVMFTFHRGRRDDGTDESMTYVADDSDMRGVRSGPNATASPYAECVAMINEVTDGWSLDAMVQDNKVGFG